MKHALKFGVLTGIVGCAYTFVLYLAGQSTSQALGLVFYLFLIGGIFLAQRAQGQEDPNTAGYGKMLVVGVVTTLAAVLIISIYTYVDLQFIDTEKIAFIKDQQAAAMEQQGMDADQIEQIQSGPFFSAGFMSTMAFVINAIVGVVISLITAAITKKKTA